MNTFKKTIIAVATLATVSSATVSVSNAANLKKSIAQGIAVGIGLGIVSAIAGKANSQPVATSVAPRQAQGVRYNCQNGPQMTVVFEQTNGNLFAHYVYDGPESAMRTARVAGHSSNGNFVDGANRINVLNNNFRTISYVEGGSFFDRCTAFQTF